jgi:hypothetical protein
LRSLTLPFRIKNVALNMKQSIKSQAYINAKNMMQEKKLPETLNIVEINITEEAVADI